MKLPISKNMRNRPQFENVGEHTEEMLFFKKFALLSLTSLSIDDGNMKFDILLTWRGGALQTTTHSPINSNPISSTSSCQTYGDDDCLVFMISLFLSCCEKNPKQVFSTL